MSPEDLFLPNCLHVAKWETGRRPRNVPEPPPCSPIASIAHRLATTGQRIYCHQLPDTDLMGYFANWTGVCLSQVECCCENTSTGCLPVSIRQGKLQLWLSPCAASTKKPVTRVLLRSLAARRALSDSGPLHGVCSACDFLSMPEGEVTSVSITVTKALANLQLKTLGPASASFSVAL